MYYCFIDSYSGPFRWHWVVWGYLGSRASTVRLPVSFPGRLRISSWSPTIPALPLGRMLIGRPSILVVQRTSPSVVSIHTRRSSLTHQNNIRRCFSPPGRCKSWTSPTSLRYPWSSDGTNGCCGTEPVPTANQPSARGPSGEQRTSGVRCSSFGFTTPIQGFRPVA